MFPLIRGCLLYTSKGDVLGCAKAAVAELYQALPRDPETAEPLVKIGHSTVTGYGEGLLLEACLLYTSRCV